MERFDFLQKPKPAVALTQLCYEVAYFVLPYYAYNDGEWVSHWFYIPEAAGLFFYLKACKNRNVEPVMEDGHRFRWHTGRMEGDREYFALEYPVPPLVGTSGITLAPHFSAIVRDGEAGDVKYFILGQAPPSRGGTTLRSVVRDGANCNLGPGPEPQLAAFLSVVEHRTKAR